MGGHREYGVRESLTTQRLQRHTRLHFCTICFLLLAHFRVLRSLSILRVHFLGASSEFENNLKEDVRNHQRCPAGLVHLERVL